MNEINRGVANINGSTGRYDGVITNPSEKFGQNAVDNYFSYLEKPVIEDEHNPAPILDFSLNPKAGEKNAEKLEKFVKKNDEYLDKLPPLEFEYRYMPNVVNGQIDKKALYSAAYEEMGRRDEVSVKELDEAYAIDDSYTYEALDVNKDGKVTVPEYSTSFLAADLASKDGENQQIDGTINSKGYNAILAYAKKANAQAASKLYSGLYSNYKLG